VTLVRCESACGLVVGRNLCDAVEHLGLAYVSQADMGIEFPTQTPHPPLSADSVTHAGGER